MSNNHFEYDGIVGRPRLAVVGREFSTEATTGTEYQIAAGIHQARSVFGGVSYTDEFANALSYPVSPGTQWDIESRYGIQRDASRGSDEPTDFNNTRIAGKTHFGAGESSSLAVFPIKGIRSAQTFFGASGREEE